MSRFARYRLSALLWAAVVAVGLLTPRSEIDGTDRRIPFWLEEGAHVVLFLVLFLLVYRALAAGRAVERPAAAACGLTLGWGLVLEVAQRWVPGRGFQPLDLWMDLLGVLLAVLLTRPWRRR